MIVVGSVIGNLFKSKFAPKFQTVLMEALGLAAVIIGIHTVIEPLDKSTLPVLFIISLAIGGILGTMWNIQGHFDRIVQRFTNSELSAGLATAVLLFCFGSLSILGPINAALDHDYSFLLTNGVLDLITSIVLGAAYGLGIAWGAVVLLGWQGSLYVLALVFRSALSPALLNELMIVGGVLIFASGLSVLEIKKINTLNFLPALLVPPLVLGILHFF
ncbi:transport protein [Ligilactobacillus pobuzihii E100301 = KCTC 13174]|uniref:Transport protein n=2 Tax=Ligilactobacillus pobuzihii TaxID=449659 RepID=A0A0R2L6U8_9LACO|nr:transport protein [Ligilactobacillus pobuzihii E100301 = KCTC 13174]KRN95558.1 transport protein [Ligilactobacillus pobuzihii]